jgi:hypothetical protein
MTTAAGGRTLVRAGLQSRAGSEAEASRGLKPAPHNRALVTGCPA